MRCLFSIALFVVLFAGAAYAAEQQMPPVLKAARMEAALAALDMSHGAASSARKNLQNLRSTIAEIETAIDGLGLLSELNGERKNAEAAREHLNSMLPVFREQVRVSQRVLEMRRAKFVEDFGEEGEAILEDRYPS